MLDRLPGPVLLDLCAAHLDGRTLAALEATSRHFSLRTGSLRTFYGGPVAAAGNDGSSSSSSSSCSSGCSSSSASIVECAAERRVLAHKNTWRVQKLQGESWKCVLWLLEQRLRPLPSVAAGEDHTLVVLRVLDLELPRRLFAYGSDAHWQLGLASRPIDQTPGPDRDEEEEPQEKEPQEIALPSCVQVAVASVAAGRTHSAALTADGSLLTWGGAVFGALGHTGPGLYGVRGRAGYAAVGQPRVIEFPGRMHMDKGPANPSAAHRVALVECGIDHTACLTATGEVFTWGFCHRGRLGHGADRMDDCHTPVPILLYSHFHCCCATR